MFCGSIFFTLVLIFLSSDSLALLPTSLYTHFHQETLAIMRKVTRLSLKVIAHVLKNDKEQKYLPQQHIGGHMILGTFPGQWNLQVA